MSFHVYLLSCSDGSYYCGHTDDLEHRLGLHAIGKGSDFTARRRPVALVWTAEFESRVEAIAVERQIKGWSRRKKQALMRGDLAALSAFARGKHRHERG